ncbi:ATP-binding protein [Streptomyces xanthochromogenes]|uniref:ATP-binding protein n=1 Tax=Streptomyces xanthochromogenes TaxID=67384 RepID=UPI003802DBBA
MSGSGDTGADRTLYDDEARPVVAPSSPRSTTALGEGRPIADARDLARRFLTETQDVHGFPAPPRAVGIVLLVVSELVTNAYKYAPGPCLLDLKVAPGTVEISVWDSEPTVPVVHPADPGRVGQHGLEIVRSLCRSFEIRREPVGKRVIATVAIEEPTAVLS